MSHHTVYLGYQELFQGNYEQLPCHLYILSALLYPGRTRCSSDRKKYMLQSVLHLHMVYLSLHPSLYNKNRYICRQSG